MGDAHAFEIVAVDPAHSFCLLGVDDRRAVRSSVVAEKVLEWHIYFPVGKAFALTPGDVWALDFQFDSTWHGKTIKICNIIDEYTREHVAFVVDRKLDAASVIELLDLACLERGGRPRVIRMDNGPEFISHALQEWATEDGTIQAFIPPGQPWHNGFVESFHNRMKDELLEDNSIEKPGARSPARKSVVTALQ